MTTQPAGFSAALWIHAFEYLVLFDGRIFGRKVARGAPLEVLQRCHSQHGVAFDAIQGRGEFLVEEKESLGVREGAGAIVHGHAMELVSGQSDCCLGIHASTADAKELFNCQSG